MSTKPAAPAIAYISTENDFFKPQPAAVHDGETPHLTVYPDATRQKIEGFGGCFNEQGWQALSVLDPAARRDVLRRFFDPAEGIGLTVCRLPIGASDYALERYSLNETAGDVEMKKFTLERDKKHLLPYIKEALGFQPKLRLWASAWTPPTWMKDNRAFDMGAFLDRPETYQAYANYLLAFIRAYRAEGVHVEAVAVQNEPGQLTHYPSCDWTAVQYLVFIRDYLGPLFEREGLRDAIMLGTLNQPGLLGHALTVLTDRRARRFVSLGGLQWYALDIVGQIKAAAPGLKIWQTETDCGNWPWMPGFDPELPPNDIVYAGYTWDKVRSWLRAGVTVYDLWNLVLDPAGRNLDTRRPWPQNAAVTVDPATRQVRYTPMFAAFGSFSKFVPPGSTLVETEGILANDAAAFSDPLGRTVVVFFNRKGAANEYRVQVGDAVYGFEMPSLSFGTLVVEAK